MLKSRKVTIGAWYAPRRFFRFPWLIPTEHFVCQPPAAPYTKRRTFDGNGRVNETDEGRRNADEVGSAAVRRARESGDVSAQPSADNQHGLLPDQPEVVHRIHNAQHRVHRLVLLAARHNECCERDAVVLEVRIPLRSIVTVHCSISDEKNASPGLVDVGEMGMGRIEDVVNKLEILGAC